MSYWDRGVEFSSLVGKTPIKVCNRDDEEIVFETADESFKMYHSQDCCEGVYVDDICGDLEDLIGSPILLAEEAEGERPTDRPRGVYDSDSETWTFYKLSTIKGSVTIRWYGSSNGYYSESVSFVKND